MRRAARVTSTVDGEGRGVLELVWFTEDGEAASSEMIEAVELSADLLPDGMVLELHATRADVLGLALDNMVRPLVAGTETS